MITPAFGDNLLHIKFTKVSVNIKVQRICLPVRARLLKVHATSTPNPVSREESSHLPFYLIYTNISYFQLVKRKMLFDQFCKRPMVRCGKLLSFMPHDCPCVRMLLLLLRTYKELHELQDAVSTQCI